MNSIDKDISPWESEATLTYLTNPVYRTDVGKKQKTEDDIAKEEAQDRKFYRKRIMELTRDMFKGSVPDRDVRTTFDDYVRTCVIHLKTLDTHDILQKDYPQDTDTMPLKEYAALDIEYTTQKTMGKPPKVENVLENFVTRTSHETPEPPPQKKVIDLKEPSLRIKGVKQKKKKKKVKTKKDT